MRPRIEFLVKWGMGHVSSHPVVVSTTVGTRWVCGKGIKPNNPWLLFYIYIYKYIYNYISLEILVGSERGNWGSEWELGALGILGGEMVVLEK